MMQPAPKRKYKLRIMVFMLAFLGVLALLIGRTAWLQLVDGAELKKGAVAQQTRDKIITSARGTIYDRNGTELAVSASVEMVTVSPAAIKAAKAEEQVAKSLAQILSLDYESVYAKVTKNSSYEIIKRKVEKEQTDQIRALKAAKDTKKAFAGVSLEEDTKRYYPFGTFASHVIGFTGTDNQGLYGIEKAYDEVLTGESGRVISAKNAAGLEMPYQYEEKYDSKDGLNVVLTIDETIQHFAEKYLQEAVDANNPNEGAVAIVMNPNNGEILAMAVKPDYDLNAPFTITDEETLAEIDALPEEEQTEAKSAALTKMWRNKAVNDTYEPGSVFKIITMAASLEEGVAKPSDTFTCTGVKHVGGHSIHCWKTVGHGHENLCQGIMNSCNPVFMELGERLGVETFRQYFKNFGFTEKTGFDLPGEGNSVYHSEEAMHEVELATSSFGQSFSITSLQMISAVSAAVNGGNLVTPHIVKSLTDDNGNVVQSFAPEAKRQVVSEGTSATIREFLEQVVSDGTGKGAYIKGYRVGGKTGTSEKLPRNQGKYIASFLGIAPANDPQLICLVIVDEPTGDLYQGSQISAPVARNILEDSLRYMGIEQQFSADELESMSTIVPEVRNLPLGEAKKAVGDLGYAVIVEGEGETVSEMLPKPGATLEKGSTVILYTGDAQISTVIVPDVVDYYLSDAIELLRQSGLNYAVVGADASGDPTTPVTKQDPPAGTEVNPASIVRIEFTYMDGD